MTEHIILALLIIVIIARSIQIGRLKKRISPFDHDGDGKPGGSKPGADMPSGNAAITYTGEEPSIEFSGETFVQGKPTTSHDQGVIGAAKDRDDFTVIDHREGEKPSVAVSAEPQTQPSEAEVAPLVVEIAPVPAEKPKAAPKKKPAAKKH